MKTTKDEKWVEATLSSGQVIHFKVFPNTHYRALYEELPREVPPEEFAVNISLVGKMSVPVSKIVGGQSFYFRRYDVNFRPKNPDLRWIEIYESMANKGEIIPELNHIRDPKIREEFEVRYIPLMVLFRKNYYVSDGHNRVSVAKLLEWKTLKSDVWKYKS